MNARSSDPKLMNKLTRVTEYFENKSKSFIIAVNIALLIGIGLVDYITGYEIGISFFYLIPISFAVWFGIGAQGIIFSLLSALTTVSADSMAGKEFPHLFIEVWNLLMHLGFFIAYAVMLSIVKGDFDKRGRQF